MRSKERQKQKIERTEEIQKASKMNCNPTIAKITLNINSLNMQINIQRKSDQINK